MKEFKVRRKYYKTILILTFGLSEDSIGESLCENPFGFIVKSAMATLAKSGRFVSDQNEGIQGAQKVLQNLAHINIWALRGVAWKAFLLKFHWVLLVKQQSQHWPNRGGS